MSKEKLLRQSKDELVQRFTDQQEQLGKVKDTRKAEEFINPIVDQLAKKQEEAAARPEAKPEKKSPADVKTVKGLKKGRTIDPNEFAHKLEGPPDMMRHPLWPRTDWTREDWAALATHDSAAAEEIRMFFWLQMLKKSPKDSHRPLWEKFISICKQGLPIDITERQLREHLEYTKLITRDDFPSTPWRPYPDRKIIV